MKASLTVSEALRLAIRTLGAAKMRAPDGVLTAEAETLLQSSFARNGLSRPSRFELYARGAAPCPEPVLRELERMSSLRATGAPLQHLTGEQAFLNHVYQVTPEVLIPRPETETLASMAFAELSSPVLGLEIGLGSGILSIELLARFPTLQMIGTEASPGALKVALANAGAILGPGANRLATVAVRDRMLVCEPLAERLSSGMRADFLISNPPYLIGPHEAEEQVVSHEPALALWSPEADPVYFYRAIARDAKELLTESAPIFVEIPHERAHEVQGVFTAQGWSVTMKADLTGRDRVLIARRKA